MQLNALFTYVQVLTASGRLQSQHDINNTNNEWTQDNTNKGK